MESAWDADIRLSGFVQQGCGDDGDDRLIESLFWTDVPKVARLKASGVELKRHGCEYEAPVLSVEQDSAGRASGDLDRRELYLTTLKVASEGAHDRSKEWYEMTLRRMSCHILERAAAAVRLGGCFKSDDDEHVSVVFAAYCGILTRKTGHKKLENLFSRDNRVHPIVPAKDLDDCSEWVAFRDTVCSIDGKAKADLTAKYAMSLVKFLVPSYIFAHGPIPNPKLWDFNFTVNDLENLYHGHCDSQRMEVVVAALESRKCRVTAALSYEPQLRAKMWNIAYATHVLLWGLDNNERRLRHLFQENQNLLVKLNDICGSKGNHAASLKYVLSVRRNSILKRSCDCGNLPSWQDSGALTCNLPCHYFWGDHRAELESTPSGATALDAQIRKEVLSWDDANIIAAICSHCNDRNFPENHHYRKFAEDCASTHGPTSNTVCLALGLGTSRATPNPNPAVGYDRMVATLTAVLRKLVLDVRQCHENSNKMDTKYWRYTSGDRSVITVPYGKDVLVVGERSPKHVSNCRIVDVGINLAGLYALSAGTVGQYCELNHIGDLADAPDERPFVPLRQFLLETARSPDRNGSFDLHGFCDGPSGVHEVRINVTLPATSDFGGQFEDLEFRVHIDNEDAQKCTVITTTRDFRDINDQQRLTSFLRLGIQLHDTGVGISPDHVVRESGDCLCRALDGERELEQASGAGMSSSHRSRAMQLSPAMLALLPRTQESLRTYLQGQFGAEVPVLLRLFDTNERVGIVGLPLHKVKAALRALTAANYNVIPITIDAESVATAYDGLKRSTLSAGVTLVYLTVLSPLPRETVKKLIELTRRSSLRFLLTASSLTAPFFTDANVSYCDAPLTQHRDPKVVKFAPLRVVIDAFCNAMLEQDGDVSSHLTSLKLWVKEQQDSLQLAIAETAEPKVSPIVVVRGNHKISYSTAVSSVIDLKQTDDQHRRIQEVLWSHSGQRRRVVIVVHTFDPSSNVLYESCRRDVVVEPVVFRPDQVILGLEPMEDRIARALGASSQQVNEGRSHPLVVKVREAFEAEIQSDALPTFHAFTIQMPVCEFLSQHYRVALYLFHMVIRRGAFMDTVRFVEECCHNYYASSIWECARDDADIGSALTLSPPSFTPAPRDAITSLDEVVAATLAGGCIIEPDLLNVWVHQTASPNAVRQYIRCSFSPLTPFVVDPISTANILSPSCVDQRTHGTAAWAKRLHACVSALDPYLQSSNIDASFPSVAKWTAKRAGCLVDVTAEDIDRVCDVGVHIELSIDDEDENIKLLRLILSLNNVAMLASQHRLRELLCSPICDGGMTQRQADTILDSNEALGALFVRVLHGAGKGSAILCSAAQQIVPSLRCADTDDVLDLIPARKLLARLTPEGWAEFILLGTAAASQKWTRLKMVADFMLTTIEDSSRDASVQRMVQWCIRQRCENNLPTEFVIRHLQGGRVLSDTEGMWPMEDLDSSDNEPFFRSIVELFAKRMSEICQPLNAETFGHACAEAFHTTTSAGRMRVMKSIAALGDHHMAYTVLWMLEPQCPYWLTFPDHADVVACMSSFMVAPGLVQDNFAAKVNNKESIWSPLALALAGRVEYLSMSMLQELSTLDNLWGGKLKLRAPRHLVQKIDSTASVAVLFTPRQFLLPIPAGSDAIDAHGLNDAIVAQGVSEAIIAQNKRYLKQELRKWRVSSQVPAAVRCVVVWFASFDVDLSSLAEFPHDFLHAKTTTPDSLSEAYCVIDARKQQQLLEDLTDNQIREMDLAPPLPSLPRATNIHDDTLAENWIFWGVPDATAEDVVRGFAEIAAVRYVAACRDAKAKEGGNEFIAMYANDALQPSATLYHGQRPDLAAVFREQCQGTVEKILLSQLGFEPQIGPVLAWAATKIEGHTKVLPEVLKARAITVSNFLHDVEEALTATPKTSNFVFPEVLNAAADSSAVSEEPQVSIFVQDVQMPLSDNIDEEAGDALQHDISSTLSNGRLAARSIDVSHILRLEPEKVDMSFHLQLKVTPGAACHLVENDGNLKISDQHEGVVVYVFKDHGEAWSFCKSQVGPLSLVGEGFFLYRPKENIGGWRCFIGGGQKKRSEFHFWHVAAYHSAMCIPIAPALRDLLYVLCAAVYDGVTPSREDVTDEQKLRLAFERLVCCDTSAAYTTARDAAAPLLMYTRLLIASTTRMRKSGARTQSGRQFGDDKYVEDNADAPPRVGTIFDAELDVLAFLKFPTSHTEGSQDDDDPAWFKSSRVHEVFPVDEGDALKLKDGIKKLYSDKTSPRIKILNCVRRLSSNDESALAESILSESSSGCSKLAHFKLALSPLPIGDTINVWTTLRDWYNDAIRHKSSLSTDDGKLTDELNKRLQSSRAQQMADLLSHRKNMSEVPLGEGVTRRMQHEIELCCTHSSNEQRQRSDQAVPTILWKDFDPDGFVIDSGEVVAYVLDGLFFYRSFSAPNHSTARRTLISHTGQKIEVHQQGETIKTWFKMKNCSAEDNYEFTVVPDERLGDEYFRLQHRQDDRMLAFDGGWVLQKPSRRSDAQYFRPGEPSAATESSFDAHFVAPLQHWVVMVMSSPMTPSWKLFFLHHTHVDSQLLAPPESPSVAYSIAQICPVPQLRNELLGALTFSPTRFCKRRDRIFGVTITSSKLDLNGDEWVNIPGKVGPIALSPKATASEQYRAITKNFALLTTHVVVEGMQTISDQLLKWCCEFTKIHPWRFVVFVQCEVRRNLPENRDRVIDLNEVTVERPPTNEVSFGDNEKHAYAQIIKSQIIRSKRTTNWFRNVQNFVADDDGGRLMMLVSPPGAGKTTALKELQLKLSRADGVRFVNFDCSSGALVHQALITLLDNALIGVELGSDKVIVVADEYHMLNRSKKAEFMRWVEPRLNAMKVILVANRDDADDAFLNEKLMKVSGTEHSIIWRARVGISAMVGALNAVGPSGKTLTRKGSTFFLTIRTLISDDVVSLRMASEMFDSTYSQPSKGDEDDALPLSPMTAIELALSAKMQPENASFVVMLTQMFDRIYDFIADREAMDIVAFYNSRNGSSNDPVELLVFTAMLPALLLRRDQQEKCDEFASFVEFVSQTVAYGVHPVVRLASWIINVLRHLQQLLPQSSAATLVLRDRKVIEQVLQTLDLMDHPTFFPITFGVGGVTRLDVCSTLVYPHPPTLDYIYYAAVRHETVDWNLLRREWEREPVADVDGMIRIVSQPTTGSIIWMHLTPSNVLSLLKCERHRDRNLASQHGEERIQERSLLQSVLDHYPQHRKEKEGVYVSPFFWSVWCRTAQLALDDGALWTALIKKYIQPEQWGPFLLWVGANGHQDAPFSDAVGRTRVAAYVLADLAEEAFGDDIRKHSQFWRCNWIAPAITVASSIDAQSRDGAISCKRAYEIAKHERRQPHKYWPPVMKALSKPRQEVLNELKKIDAHGVAVAWGDLCAPMSRAHSSRY